MVPWGRFIKAVDAQKVPCALQSQLHFGFIETQGATAIPSWKKKKTTQNPLLPNANLDNFTKISYKPAWLASSLQPGLLAGSRVLRAHGRSTGCPTLRSWKEPTFIIP